MAQDRYWIWLSRCRGIGAMTAWRLIRELGSPETVFYADADTFHQVSFLNKAERESLLDKSLTETEEILAKCRENDIFIVTPDSPIFPERLKAIPDPPTVLYGKGTLPDVDREPCAGVVGTRSCTDYGLRTATRIAFEYARCGGTVITGLARGVDTAAAKGALRGGGKVIGVLGCGVNVVYPAENRRLFEDVCRNGAILSEYCPDTPPFAGQFPARNRLISGLSVGIVLVEAPKRSGALITAAKALEQGRDVFSVPGNVDAESCRGSNAILREGASPITSGFDLADEYRPMFPQLLSEETCPSFTIPQERRADQKEEKTDCIPIEKRKVLPVSIDKAKKADYIDRMQRNADLNADEKNVLLRIGNTETPVDDIIEQCGLPSAQVLRTLTMLQLKGYVDQHSGKSYTRKEK